MLKLCIKRLLITKTIETIRETIPYDAIQFIYVMLVMMVFMGWTYAVHNHKSIILIFQPPENGDICGHY